MTQVEVEKRITAIEKIIQEIVTMQAQTEKSILKLTVEIRDLKDETNKLKDIQLRTDENVNRLAIEMKEFKDEMKEFKDEMRKQSKEMNKRWGDLANKMGTIVEDLVIPNLPLALEKYFSLQEPSFVITRAHRKLKDKKIEKEFDGLVIYDGPKIIVLNETKSKADKHSIDEFADFIQSSKFFEFFPEYKEYKLLPIYSSLYIDEKLVNYLTNKKIFAVHIEGDILTFKNLDKLKEVYNIK